MPANTLSDIVDICVYRNMRYKFSSNEVVEERVQRSLLFLKGKT